MKLGLRQLGLQPYETVWLAMQHFTQQRDEKTLDEVWLVEHPAIYTLGLTDRQEHILNPGKIPVVTSDRGGQVTYHGPGQLIVYTLIDLRRIQFGIRDLVNLLENSVIGLLAKYGIKSESRADAPGVYVNGAKIASVGLKIRRHCSYHGLALNVDMDLSPFQGINPCGYTGLTMTQLADLEVKTQTSHVAVPLLAQLLAQLPHSGLALLPPNTDSFFPNKA